MTNYVHVVLPDGSAVTRGSKNRNYTHAVVRHGATKQQALKRVRHLIDTLWINIESDMRDLKTVTEGVAVIEEDKFWNTAHFNLGTEHISRTVSKDKSAEEARTEWAAHFTRMLDDNRKQLVEEHALLDYLNKQEWDYTCTHDIPRSRVFGLRPAVLGFSQSLDNARSRANTEMRNGHVGDLTVVPTTEGKAPKDAPKGHTI